MSLSIHDEFIFYDESRKWSIVIYGFASPEEQPSLPCIEPRAVAGSPEPVLRSTCRQAKKGASGTSVKTSQPCQALGQCRGQLLGAKLPGQLPPATAGTFIRASSPSPRASCMGTIAVLPTDIKANLMSSQWLSASFTSRPK